MEKDAKNTKILSCERERQQSTDLSTYLSVWIALNCPHANTTHSHIVRIIISISISNRHAYTMLIWIFTLPRKYHICALSAFHSIVNGRSVDRKIYVCAVPRVYWKTLCARRNRVDYSSAKLASQSFMGMPTDYNVHSLICALRDNFVWIVLSVRAVEVYFYRWVSTLVPSSNEVFSFVFCFFRWMAKIILNKCVKE